jgi:hypothetical protein
VLLNESAVPTQTLKIARERLEEARAMLRSIDSFVIEELWSKSPVMSERHVSRAAEWRKRG